ncbi:hypothetical protein RJ55_00606 [Drechmeria coniospora]|nr:hypothetical protein RJ55_00606 [Drechmeria coniospora]
MQFISVVAALLSIAQAVDVHIVAVGKNPMNNQTGLKYYPEKIKALPGSMVQYQFWDGNHTVTQSSFDKPCVPLSVSNTSAVGVYSSFQPAAASQNTGRIPVFSVMINDTKPIWLYCGQGTHCQKGMVMVINENTQANASRSLENYKKLAEVATQGNSGIPSGGNGSNSGNNSSSKTTPGTQSTSVKDKPTATSVAVSAANSRIYAATSTLLLLGIAFVLL